MQPPQNLDISIVVPTFNRAGMLRHALESLVSQETGGTFAFEIVVVDDGSTDGTADVILKMVEEYPEVTWQHFYQEHRGVGAARNRGIVGARGAWIAFFDDDQLAEPRWLAKLYRAAQESGSPLVEGSVLLEISEKQRTGLGPKSLAMLGEKYFPAGLNPQLLRKVRGTGNILIHKSVLDQVGLFDESLPRLEDWDFFLRLEKSNLTFNYAPLAIVHHVIPEFRATPAQLKKLCQLNGFADAIIRYKQGGPGKLALTLLWRLGVTVGRDFPSIIISAILKDKSMLSDARCSWWYTLGFLGRSLHLFAPGTFSENLPR